MSNFDLLNSATKYPSIKTYHAINPQDGKLRMPAMFFGHGPVALTEKVDGISGRIVVMPDGDWFIGSREELLYARGDRIENPNLGIVPALLAIAPALPSGFEDITVYYLEVYGHQAGPAGKQYTASGQVGYRLFDVANVPSQVTEMPRELIAAWRDRGGQQFGTEEGLTRLAKFCNLPMTPRLGVVNGAELPVDLEGMQEFLKTYLPRTQVALDEGAGGRPEGIVLRTADRSLIAKAKFKDYARTLAPEQKKGKPRG